MGFTVLPAHVSLRRCFVTVSALPLLQGKAVGVFELLAPDSQLQCVTTPGRSVCADFGRVVSQRGKAELYFDWISVTGNAAGLAVHF